MRKPRPVSELLAEGQATLQRLKTGADVAARTLAAVQHALPREVADHVFAATLDGDGALTVLVDSGAFATRVRYLLPGVVAELGSALDGNAITRTRVRVRPRQVR